MIGEVLHVEADRVPDGAEVEGAYDKFSRKPHQAQESGHTSVFSDVGEAVESEEDDAADVYEEQDDHGFAGLEYGTCLFGTWSFGGFKEVFVVAGVVEWVLVRRGSREVTSAKLALILMRQVYGQGGRCLTGGRRLNGRQLGRDVGSDGRGLLVVGLFAGEHEDLKVEVRRSEESQEDEAEVCDEAQVEHVVVELVVVSYNSGQDS